jgi:hypothetical protein
MALRKTARCAAEIDEGKFGAAGGIVIVRFIDRGRLAVADES